MEYHQTNRANAIRALDSTIIGKIAAGEVVERPAFAIKELIENSIDAGATAISVLIREGGLSYFRIVDNGCGIDPSDVRMAFMRHATSKLRTEQDLYAIHTLGFRGEALHSIAAVAKVEMVTRRTGYEHGVKAVVEGGVVVSLEEAPSPEGTSITVRDLFYNTPARQKFLKKPATEAGLVSDLVMRLIIARPDISFRLHNEERKIYHSTGNGNMRDALLAVVGHDTLAQLREVKGSAAGCALSGYIGIGDLARSSRTMQTFILNGRYVRNAFLSQALDEGCRETVMTGKHPICALHLTMPFEMVDVNVHPNKLEVRFTDERALLMGITGIIRSALKEESFKASQKLDIDVPPTQNESGSASSKTNRSANRFASGEHTPVFIHSEQTPIVIPSAQTPAAFPSEQALPFMPVVHAVNETSLEQALIMQNRPAVHLSDSASRIPRYRDQPSPSTMMPFASDQIEMSQVVARNISLSLRIVGTAWLEYVFATCEDMLYIIDQHAAHERILFERMQKALDQNMASQLLLVPTVVQLTHREHAALITCMDDLQRCGFDIEDYGDRAIQTRAIPMVLGVPQVKDFFGELADCISEYRAIPTQEKRRELLVKTACKKAVKAGDSLSIESIERIIDEIQQTGTLPTCPHGRPIVVSIAKVELDKRFRRV